MKFNIISINDDRKAYKDAIRSQIGIDEVHVPAFNAYKEDPLAGIKARGLELKPEWNNAKKGELGVWLSNYDCWGYCDMLGEPLVVFEDDAILTPDYNMRFSLLMDELPSDWDFAALWVPGNQLVDYDYDVSYDEAGNPRIGSERKYGPDSYYYRPGTNYAALVYQGYGMVSLVYSPDGARKLVDLAHKRGIDGPVDCWVYQEAHKGNLNGFAPYPWETPIVDYDWAATSHVQQTERAL